jgi:hypothetical protein
LPFLQNRGRKVGHRLLKQLVARPCPLVQSEHVKTVFNVYVYAVFELGNWGISTSISKNVYERFLFSRSFHSPPSLKVASPADFA